jgi:hypothetical protein
MCFEWKADLSNTILEGTDPLIIPARFDLIWFRSFRGEDLNVKVDDVRRSDIKREALRLTMRSFIEEPVPTNESE